MSGLKTSLAGRSEAEGRKELRYVIIEGVIGVGKTTLAHAVADSFSAELILEPFHENPFLSRFYEDPERWAFQTQLSFLAGRFQQQKRLAERGFDQLTVSDYSFDKDRLFARVNLAADELALYETLFELMQPSTPVPDLMVYLKSCPSRLMDNIKKRGRPFEQSISRDYISALSRIYDDFFESYAASPLLVVPTTEIDFVENPDVMAELLHAIVGITHQSISYFEPGTDRASS